MNNATYQLKSIMIYSGSGLRGHWRSAIKEGSGFLLYYDDDSMPKLLKSSEIKEFLCNGTDYTYVADVTEMEELPVSEPRVNYENQNPVSLQKNVHSTMVSPMKSSILNHSAGDTDELNLTNQATPKNASLCQWESYNHPFKS